jgi:hypothetical protein
MYPGALSDIRFASYVIHNRDEWLTFGAIDAQMNGSAKTAALMELASLEMPLARYLKTNNADDLQTVLSGVGATLSSLFVDHAFGGDTLTERFLAQVAGFMGEEATDGVADAVAHAGQPSPSLHHPSGKAGKGVMGSMIAEAKNQVASFAHDAVVDKVKGYLPEPLKNISGTLAKSISSGRDPSV